MSDLTDDELKPMTEGEAWGFGMTPITFGRYEDVLYCDIPYEYLTWLADTKRTEWRELRRYLMTRTDGVSDEAV